MTASDQFRPNWASAPGDTITDILRERGWSVKEFAKRMGHTADRTNDLLQGRVTITIRTARELKQVLGASVEFWMARDVQFREDAGRLRAADREWLRELPLSDMIRFGWLTPPPQPSEEVESCLRFFGVPSVATWRHMYEGVQAQVAFRTSRKFDFKPGAVAAWLRQGEIVGTNMQCASWDPRRFRASLSEARRLTLAKDPNHFLPELHQLCAAAGVAVAVVRAPNGCRASGATRFLSAQKGLLLLSFRYLSDDQFWFTFFHEAGHLLLHGQERLFLEGLDAQSATLEDEANRFAEQVIIPTEFRETFFALPTDVRAIVRFAKLVGVAPGIVAGQLQHYDRIPHNRFNGLKRRYEWT
jgi:HTH-type transcriptional regulator/antitoxin HigA